MVDWVVDLDEKGHVLLFGPFRIEGKGQSYLDKNCGQFAELFSVDYKGRDTAKVKQELESDIKRIIARRNTQMEQK